MGSDSTSCPGGRLVSVAELQKVQRAGGIIAVIGCSCALASLEAGLVAGVTFAFCEAAHASCGTIRTLIRLMSTSTKRVGV